LIREALYSPAVKKRKNLVEISMTKRTNLEITAAILSFCKQPRTKTHVMYNTNLSWRMTQKYLSQLQSLELLEVHHSQTKYATTQKGLKFVEKWRELAALL
jgi:predicted transcriptional regulator